MAESIYFLFGDLPRVVAVLSVLLSPVALVFVMVAWKRKQFGKGVMASLISAGLLIPSISYIGNLNGVSLTFGGYAFGATAIVGGFIVASILAGASFKFLNHLSSVLTEHIEEMEEEREMEEALRIKREKAYADLDNIDRQMETAKQKKSKKKLLRRVFKM